MRKSGSASSEVALLLRLLDEAFNRKSWHGTNLRGALRGVTARQAAWRSSPRRHSIAELATHAAYWKYSVRRRITGEKRATFPLKGSNWFPQPEPLSQSEWKRIVKLLEAEHKALRDAVAKLDPRTLNSVPKGSRTTHVGLIQGVALHDVHHGGQIQLLKRLMA